MPFAICEARVMSWPQADPLDSDRLALEPLAVDHAAEMLTALAPPELYRFTGGEPPTLDELGARYRRQSRGQSEYGSAGWLNWIVRPARGGPAIGFVQATLERKEDGLVADLAWLVTPEEQGRGIAVEAAATVVTWLRSIDVRPHQGFHPSRSHRLDARGATDRACTHERSGRRRAPLGSLLAYGR